MDLKTVPIKHIKPYWRNPRMNDDAIESVRQSIEEYGYLQPIVVDEENVIVVGHTRYKALQQLGYDEVNVLVTSMHPEKAKEYRIVDNASGDISTWDYDKLLPELREFEAPEKLQLHFPALDIASTLTDLDFTGNHNPVSQSQIDNRSSQMGSEFLKRNTEELDGYVPLICPECGEEFAVNKDDFLNRIQPNGNGLNSE